MDEMNRGKIEFMLQEAKERANIKEITRWRLIARMNGIKI